MVSFIQRKYNGNTGADGFINIVSNANVDHTKTTLTLLGQTLTGVSRLVKRRESVQAEERREGGEGREKEEKKSGE